MPFRSLLAAALAVLLGFSQAAAYFDDLYIEDPNFKAIVFLRSLGIIEGYADNTFRPDQPVSRAEFAKLLVESLQVRPDAKRYRDCFHDVTREWFAPYVCYAKAAGIVQGLTPQDFAPANKVTRAEATKMVIVAFGMDALPPVVRSLYKDVQPTDWHAPFLHRARLDNILPVSEFAFPNGAASRGIAAELLYRAMLMDLQSMPAFDEAKADEFLKKELQIDLSNSVDAPLSDDDVAQQMAIYRDVVQQLRALHPNGEKPSLKEYVYASIEGLARETGDPYTVFLRPQDSQDFTDELNGELTGIGVEIAEDPLGALILNVLPDSPAMTTGLQPGDVVTKVGEKELAGMHTQEIVRLMRGGEGTQVTIQVAREKALFTYTITRARLQIPSAILELESNVAVIRLTQFGDDTGKELRDIITGLPAGTRGIVLDLRNNGGGYMEAAQSIAGFFLPANSPAFSLVDAQGQKEEVPTTGTQLTTLPLVVLVNGYSASAAEVVAGALRDNGRATLVGEKTFGKGTIQTLLTYADGSMLRVTIARWFTPKGDSVGDVDGVHNGIVPTQHITDDEATEADEQLQKALSLIP